MHSAPLVDESQREDLEYRALFRSMPAHVLVMRADSPRFTIVDATDAYLRTTMTKREDIVGRGAFRIFPDNPSDPRPTGVATLSASFDRVIRERVTDDLPLQKYDIPRPDGAPGEFEERWWHIVNSPVLGPDGRVLFVINRVEDKTQLVRAEAAELEQRRRTVQLDDEIRLRTREIEEANQRLNRANAEMSELLGMISHDLRNPLGTILLSAELMRRNATDPARSSRDPADVIARAAKRMERLIQDLLDVSRIEAGAFSVQAARVTVGDLLDEAIEAHRARSADASVELRVEVAEGAREVWADRHRLLQVLENLIGNALKFTSAGGAITVGARSSEGEVLFWTQDSGPGIAPDDQPRIFDRFWRAAKNGRRGAGLGLAIVKGIVEAHGGRVWVESSVGRGTTFFFTMPTSARREEPQHVHA